MNDDNIYLLLQSNKADMYSDYGKSHNQLSDYCIEYKTPFDFGVNKYEVALIQCAYRKLIEVDVGTITLKTYDNYGNFKQSEKFYLKSYEGVGYNTIIKLIEDTLNNAIPESYKTTELMKDGTKIRKMDFIWEIDYKQNIIIEIPYTFEVHLEGPVTKMFKDIYIDKSAWPIDEEFMFINDIEMNTKKDVLKLDDGSLVLNLRGRETSYKHKERLYLNRKVYHLEEIFIYTNLTKPMYISNQQDRLLRMITDNAKTGDIVEYNVTNPIYLPVDVGIFDKIRIKMCNSEGEPIKFMDHDSKVDYLLHFRKISIN